MVKTATTPAAGSTTLAGSAVDTRRKSSKPVRILSTCGCLFRATDLLVVCPTCGEGVIDVVSRGDGSFRAPANNGKFDPIYTLLPLLILRPQGRKRSRSHKAPRYSPAQEQQDDDSRILSVYFGSSARLQTVFRAKLCMGRQRIVGSQNN